MIADFFANLVHMTLAFRKSDTETITADTFLETWMQRYGKLEDQAQGTKGTADQTTDGAKNLLSGIDSSVQNGYSPQPKGSGYDILNKITQTFSEAELRYKNGGSFYKVLQETAPSIKRLLHRYPDALGTHVSLETFHTLGFQGIQRPFRGFGTKKQQAQLARLYDCLRVFSEATGVPMDALSLGGNLSIKMTRGGTPYFSAVPAKGDATLGLPPEEGVNEFYPWISAFAHEWFHALDYMLAQGKDYDISKTKKSYRFLSEFKGNNARIETQFAFAYLTTLLESSSYFKRLEAIDKRRGKAYLTSPSEMVAWAFEGYFLTRLSGGSEMLPYTSGEAHKNAMPYLYEKETAEIFHAFDNLFNTLKVGENASTGIKTLYSLPALEGLTKARSFVTTPVGKRIVLKIFDAMWTKRPELVTNKIDQSPAKGQHERNTEMISQRNLF